MMSSYSFLLSLKPGPGEQVRAREAQPRPRGQGGDQGWKGEPPGVSTGGYGCCPSPCLCGSGQSRSLSEPPFAPCTVGTIKAPILTAAPRGKGCSHTATIATGTRANCQGGSLGPSLTCRLDGHPHLVGTHAARLVQVKLPEDGLGRGEQRVRAEPRQPALPVRPRVRTVEPAGEGGGGRPQRWVSCWGMWAPENQA